MAVEIACPCGQTIYSDDPPGTEIRCVNCDKVHVVPGDAAATRPKAAVLMALKEIEYISKAPGDIIFSPRAFEMLRKTSPWVRIISVLIFIGTGFLVLGGIILTLLTAMKRSVEDLPVFLGPVYLAMSFLYVIPGVFLWRYASHIRTFVHFRYEKNLEDALQAQKSFWKYVAICILVFICLYVLIAGMLIVGMIVKPFRVP